MDQKIDFDEIIKLIEDTYKIKKVRFMQEWDTKDGDAAIHELPDYVSGECVNGGENRDTSINSDIAENRRGTGESADEDD